MACQQKVNELTLFMYIINKKPMLLLFSLTQNEGMTTLASRSRGGAVGSSLGS
jgi:hypothetical protein